MIQTRDRDTTKYYHSPQIDSEGQFMRFLGAAKQLTEIEAFEQAPLVGLSLAPAGSDSFVILVEILSQNQCREESWFVFGLVKAARN
jgi:hypothetical protein